MPRRFSRGKKIVVETIWDFIRYLSPTEDEEFTRQVRLRYCPALPLEEQELLIPLLELLRKVQWFDGHLRSFHASLPHLYDDWLHGIDVDVRSLIHLVEEAYQDRLVV